MAQHDKKQIPEGGWEAYYRRYQYRLAKEYLVPILGAWGVTLDGKQLLEVGSGNGGCGEACAREGSIVTAMDTDERLVGVSRELNNAAGVNIDVHVGDVCDASCPAFTAGPFDVVMIRDVMEHIERPAVALTNMAAHLSDDGVIFVVFPPYYSPYGAHQQILPRKQFAGIPYNKLPFIQFLPNRLFSRIAGGEDSQSKEVRRLRDIRLTLKKFERVTLDSGLAIRKRRYYLSRPTFALRYGMPVVGASIIGQLPLLRELLVTAAYYILEKP